MKVLSLFNGISCGRLALERAGIKVDRYVSYEIDKYANSIAKFHYPNDEYCGDVTTADFTQYVGFDIIIGGSPCQNLSIAGNKKGLEGDESKLFFEFVRAIKEAKPKYFLLENNASMTVENRNIISEIMGCEPILINSGLVSAQDRKRLYWTNIPNITQPKDKGLLLRDIVEDESTKGSLDITIDMLLKTKGTLAFKKAWSNVRTLDQKAKTLTTCQSISNSGATNVKYASGRYYKLSPVECERLQTLPDNYTLAGGNISNTQRYKVTGNGWMVDVIAHILSHLPKENTITKLKNSSYGSARTYIGGAK